MIGNLMKSRSLRIGVGVISLSAVACSSSFVSCATPTVLSSDPVVDAYRPLVRHVVKDGRALTVRVAKAEDCGTVLAMIKSLAVYEREPNAVEVTEDILLRDGFGTQPLFKCFLADLEGSGTVGFALFFNTYSTWQGKSLYLEDLFIEEEHRAQGIGGLLLKTVVAEARRTGCARVNWSALKWNTPATDFYKSIGAILLEEWEMYRLRVHEMDSFLRKQ